MPVSDVGRGGGEPLGGEAVAVVVGGDLELGVVEEFELMGSDTGFELSSLGRAWEGVGDACLPIRFSEF